MARGVVINNKERKACIARIKAFIKEFAAKPEHSINLNYWYATKQYDPICFAEMIQNGLDPHCRSVGCVGGYASHSPLMKEFESTPFWCAHRSKEESLFLFFGLTNIQAQNMHLFDGRNSLKPRAIYTDKQEGLDRLKKVLKYHQTKLVI